MADFRDAKSRPGLFEVRTYRKRNKVTFWFSCYDMLFTLPTSSTFTIDGSFIVSGDGGGMLRVWSVTSGECLNVAQTDKHTIQALTFDPERRFLITGCIDGAIRLWNIA